MLRRSFARRRRGATVVECAIVYPLMFFFILGIVIGGLGVFRYQETAALAREGARWAAVHGATYALDSGKPAATPADVYNNAILPRAVSLDPQNLGYSVAWSDPDEPRGATVTVTVTYTWRPELILVGRFTLSSTANMTVTY